jgi:tRNA (guanine37-N1)-methyltransferase
MIIDAVTRLLPGALGNEDSAVNESFSALPLPLDGTTIPPFGLQSPRENGPTALLDFPHYTRPASFRGWNVPEILLGGNHEQIRAWRRRQAVEKTRRNRPELLNRPFPRGT